jgi:Xaa-Pro aminopeptidase
VADVIVHGDTLRTPELRHEVPVGVGDPFLYFERDGARHVVIHAMEAPRLRQLDGVELHTWEEFGADELRAAKLPGPELREEVHLRALQRLGVSSAVVPAAFPLVLADKVRGAGIELAVDQGVFDDRRRVKNAAELAGIRRAQRAAEAGMTVARDLLRRAEPGDGGLVADGSPLTVERIKAAMLLAFVEAGTSSEELILSHGAQCAIAHHMGEGWIQPDESIVIDVWPKDPETGCYADMTRTFVVGDPGDDLRAWHAAVKESLDRSLAAIRAGAETRDVYDASCEPIEAIGQPTQRTKEPGTVLENGFFHGLGHGVGLEVHEEPGFAIVSTGKLRAGDVVTVEPGIYRQGFGGVRLEDLVLVTDGGYESLTDFPYDLTP